MNKTDTAYILVGKDWAKKERKGQKEGKKASLRITCVGWWYVPWRNAKLERGVKMCVHGGQGPGLGASVWMGSRKP